MKSSKYPPHPRKADAVPRNVVQRILSRRLIRRLPEFVFRGSAVALAAFALLGFNPQALAATYTWLGRLDAVALSAQPVGRGH